MNDNLDALVNLPAHLSSLEILERLAASDRISEPFRQGIKRELARARMVRDEAQRSEGVHYAGMEPDPYRIADPRNILRQAEAEEARRNSPRGRFCEALAALERLPGYGAEAGTLRGIYDRELADEREPLNAAAVGAALAILTGAFDIYSARAGIDALIELLMQEGKPAR